MIFDCEVHSYFMNKAYLLTGGNLGDRCSNLLNARNHIIQHGMTIATQSSVYETAAWGVTEQPAFLNQVLEVQTTLPAKQLLVEILSIETSMGRQRTQPMGPRIIDIDILFYNNEVVNLPDLIIPHPRLANRRFVLEPLHEIAPNLVHPVYLTTIKEILGNCNDALKVKLYNC